MAREFDPRLLNAAVRAAQVAAPPMQQQWNPVLGFLLPLYGQLIVADVRNNQLEVSEEGRRGQAMLAWDTALAALRQIGLDFVPPLGCKPIDNESAAERAINRGLDEAGKDMR